MKLTNPTAQIWSPDGKPAGEALARTTHLGIGAHQDDLEVMCLEGILAGFGRQDRWFTGVIVTDGAGSARDALYARYSNDEMKAVRREEQKKAAFVGDYAAVALLDYPSAEAKDPANHGPESDIRAILEAARPDVVYLHNPADKHPTHVATMMQALRALRSLPKELRPRKLYGCEVWRDLDWMLDEDKVVFRLDERGNIAISLLGVFDSQIAGGKRYDFATMARRRANATFHESHSVDASQMIDFGMDMTPLIEDDSLSVTAFVMGHIERFAESVRSGLARFE